MPDSKLENHLTIIGWAHLGYGMFLMAVAGLVFFAVFVGGQFAGEADTVIITSVVAITILIGLTIVGFPNIIAGYGILDRKPWGRVLALIISVFNLINMPLGTLLALYTFVILFRRESAHYFRSSRE